MLAVAHSTPAVNQVALAYHYLDQPAPDSFRPLRSLRRRGVSYGRPGALPSSPASARCSCDAAAKAVGRLLESHRRRPWAAKSGRRCLRFGHKELRNVLGQAWPRPDSLRVESDHHLLVIATRICAWVSLGRLRVFLLHPSDDAVHSSSTWPLPWPHASVARSQQPRCMTSSLSRPVKASSAA